MNNKIPFHNSRLWFDDLVTSEGFPKAMNRLVVSAVLGESMAISLLIELLRDASPKTASAAARGLGIARSMQAVTPLIEALGRHDAPDKDRGFWAGVFDILPNYRVANQAAIALGKIGDVRAIPPLINALYHFWVGNSASSGLEWFGDKAVVPLIRLLEETSIQPAEESNIRAREMAAMTLGRLRDTRAIVPLIRLLKDQASSVRVSAISALGQYRNPMLRETITDVIANDVDKQVRKEAKRALKKINGRH